LPWQHHIKAGRKKTFPRRNFFTRIGELISVCGKAVLLRGQNFNHGWTQSVALIQVKGN
jgi:hypothetical protein